MSNDGTLIRKRNGQWQIRRAGKTIKEFPAHKDCVDYLAAQHKTKEAMRQLGRTLIHNMMQKRGQP